MTKFTSKLEAVHQICIALPELPECQIMSNIAEILIAQIWNSQWFRQPLETHDARQIRVVYPGIWSHGFGPDFRDAMLDIDGRLVTGDVEVETDVDGWTRHGHDQNDAFDNVILQVVARDRKNMIVRRSNGGLVPRVILPDFLDRPLDEFAKDVHVRPLGAIGFDSCAPDVVAEHPELVREVWQRAGDRRMQEKVAAIAGELAISPPAQVLYARMLDALGFSRNREPMAEVAVRLRIEQLLAATGEDDPRDRFWVTAALMLGTGGFLPLSPRDAAIAGLEPTQIGRVESRWREAGTAWHGIEVSPGFWTLARLRPAAHPVRRLLAAAAIFSSTSGSVVEHLVRLLSAPEPRQAVQQWLIGDNPWLGKDHGHELIVNVIVPFALAYGDEARQSDISDAAAELWQQLPAGRGNAITKATRAQICGERRISPGSARAEQGLLHINRNGCTQMRCFECPIAHLALHWQSRSEADSGRL